MRKLATIVLFLVIVSNSFGQSKNSPLQISHLTGDFYVYRTFNDYKGVKVSANAMYVVTKEGVVLFDAPWDKTQFQPLLDSIEAKHNKKVVMVFATHSHEDRAGGLDFYKQKGIRTYSGKLTDEILKKNNEGRAEFIIPDDATFTVGQYTFEVYYPGKGHAPDNIVVWFGKEKILYGGCFIKSAEAKDLGNLGDADVKEWERSIKKVQSKFKYPKYVIPGHDDGTTSESINHTLKLVQDYNLSNNTSSKSSQK
ncbi:MAG: subclass B1 metallo-beta-lactamase [Flavobacterium nitrogenifigens]|uniref:beta-lactamase n=1 Tax=Flavobacterium nitrogenifigens TaxID=1617283 RepID=A0A521B8V7_9FLAO|nr:subclass B1 metallo-beta-lactamase [Flavobacterium nitrogenifigens]KAF2334507.1 subclass B1 metallo-beta-lactamase [Flavobacterium nitrogenifigens]MDQ8015134.1 subclass B1 metallo-beta-lactamase [Flavobacterium nitrogenifigens]SMO43451.1 metallo-beta-lactamase class B [Flavobacterium nitrogenifigens]